MKKVQISARLFREAAIKKTYFFSGPATDRGGRVRANSGNFFVATKLKGEGCKALVAEPQKNTVIFCGFP